MTLIHQAHDKFFKRSLKEKRIAIDFLKAHLPSALYTLLDTDTLVLTDKSLVLPKLREIHSDIVYRCRINNHEGYIVFLIEHLSNAPKHMAFRHLQYSVGLMDDHLREGHDKLPVILPICLYHGSESPYPHSTDIYDLFSQPELAREILFKPFQLIDLTTMTDEVIEQHGLAALMEMLFKHYRAKDFVSIVKRIMQRGLLTPLLTVSGSNYLEGVLHYIFYTDGGERTQSAEALIEMFIETLPNDREVIMTFAEQLEQKGRQEGRQEGQREKTLAIAKGLLEMHVELHTIQKVTELSYQEIEKLRFER